MFVVQPQTFPNITLLLNASLRHSAVVTLETIVPTQVTPSIVDLWQ